MTTASVRPASWASCSTRFATVPISGLRTCTLPLEAGLARLRRSLGLRGLGERRDLVVQRDSRMNAAPFWPQAWTGAQPYFGARLFSGLGLLRMQADKRRCPIRTLLVG